jgi:hypothetical protein
MEEMNGTLGEALELGRFLREKINDSGREQGLPHWTGAVQLAFTEYLAQKEFGRGSEILPPLDPQKTASRKDEFLVDFVLWRRDLPKGKSGAWIACESEWKPSEKEVLKDFEKLLSFKAPYKVMIYGIAANAELGKRIRNQFDQYLKNFQWHTAEEIYIFLEFVDGIRIAEIYTCVPSKEVALELAPNE